MVMNKPTRACDIDLEKVRFPILGMPKIDGVRAYNSGGKILARSGKPFANKLVNSEFNLPELDGLDGEMTVRNVAPDRLCSATTSALGTVEGTVSVDWNLFDGFSPSMGYSTRYGSLKYQLLEALETQPQLEGRIKIIPATQLDDLDELLAFHELNLSGGYEGSIFRALDGRYKPGKCTVNEGYYLRLKDFIDSEIIVESIEEGAANNNEAKRGPNGQLERSSHAANKQANGQVGALIGRLYADVVYDGRKLFNKGDTIRIGAGRLTKQQRLYYFENPQEIIGKLAKFQHFPKGVKDKPRFPTFISLRLFEDL